MTNIANSTHLQYNHYIDNMRVRQEIKNSDEGISLIVVVNVRTSLDGEAVWWGFLLYTYVLNKEK